MPLLGAGVSFLLILSGIAEGRPAITVLQALGLIAIVGGLRLGWWLSIAAAAVLSAFTPDSAHPLVQFSVAFGTLALAGLFLLAEAHRSWTLRARTRLMLVSAPLVAVPLAVLVVALRLSVAVPVLATLLMASIAGALALRDGLLVVRRTQLPKAGPYLLTSVVIGELLAGWRWHDRHVGAIERTILARAVREQVEPALQEAGQYLASAEPRRAEQPVRRALAALGVLEAERRMPLIESEGLGTALEWLAERTQVTSGLSVAVDAGADDRDRRPPLPVLQEAFRFVRGALRLAALDPDAVALVRVRVHTRTRLVVSVRAPFIAGAPQLEELGEEHAPMGVAVRVTRASDAAGQTLVTFRWQPRGLAIWPEAWRRPLLARISEVAGIGTVVVVLALALALGLQLPAALWIGAIAAVLLLLLRYQPGWWLTLVIASWVAWAVWIKGTAGVSSEVASMVIWMAPFIVVACYTAWQLTRPFSDRRKLWVGWPAAAALPIGLVLWWLARFGLVPVVAAFILAMATITMVLALTLWAWMDRLTVLGAPAPYGGTLLPNRSDAGERGWRRRLETAVDRALPSSHWRLVYERDERRALIARMLHGEVQPMLAAGLWALAAGDVERAQRNVRDARFALAELADGKGPPVLARDGLVAATRWMAEASGARWGGVVEVNAPEVSSARPPPSVELAAYTVAHHAVVNALRHTPSRRVRVELRTVSAKRVDLSVLDEGPGIDLAAVVNSARTGGRGMAEMRDAASDVEADVAVERRPEGGTEVRFSWRRGL